MRKSISPDVALVPKLINVSQSNVEKYMAPKLTAKPQKK